MTRPHPSRRLFLRGLGACLALPWLESAGGPLRAATRGLGGDEGEGPLRLLYVYLPNGVHVPDWLPTDPQGAGKPGASGDHRALPTELPPSLAAIDGWRDRVSLLTGLTCDKARANGDGPGDHARAAAAFLTGVQPLKADGAVRLGPSADQLAAQAIGGRTRLRSIQLGLEAAGKAGQCDSGYACAYSDNISWQDATTPASKDVHQQRLFDRLFRGDTDGAVDRAARLRRRRSVVDLVREDAKSLGHRLNRADLDKLDEYFEGLRELERRLDFAEETVDLSVADEERPPGIPSGFREHLRLLVDMLVLAWRTDTTRIGTLMFGNEGSGRRYLEVGSRGGHHAITHHKGDEAMIEQVRAINKLHAEEFTYLLSRLRDTVEGDGELLGRTMVVCGSGIADGNRHDHHALPILVAGGEEAGLRHGRWRRYPLETPLGNLHLDLIARLGVEPAKLGDATGRLDGLEA
ncbi:MAG: DUF1552 domain-containing protein [Planctomycetota bacterium]|jgi:hypothetical protein